MSKIAFIDVTANRIVATADAPEGLRALPIVETHEPLGADQVYSSPDIAIEEHRVVLTYRGVRALSGKVAILDASGRVVEVRDLGPDRVQVRDTVLPFVAEPPPAIDEARQVLEAVTSIENGVVVERQKARDRTSAEIAADDVRRAAAQRETVLSRIGTGVFQVLVNLQAQLATVTKQPAPSEEELLAQIAAAEIGGDGREADAARR